MSFSDDIDYFDDDLVQDLGINLKTDIEYQMFDNKHKMKLLDSKNRITKLIAECKSNYSNDFSDSSKNKKIEDILTELNEYLYIINEITRSGDFSKYSRWENSYLYKFNTITEILSYLYKEEEKNKIHRSRSKKVKSMTCESCGGKIKVSGQNIICLNCSRIMENINMKNSTVPTNSAAAKLHLNEWLLKIQGKENLTITEKELNLIKDKYVLIDQLHGDIMSTIDKISLAINESKLTKYNLNAISLMQKITGEEVESISEYDKTLIEEVYLKYCSIVKHNSKLKISYYGFILKEIIKSLFNNKYDKIYKSVRSQTSTTESKHKKNWMVLKKMLFKDYKKK